MRLSDIRGERVFDVVADIIDPIVEIAQDKDAAELFSSKTEKPEDMTNWEFFLQRARKSLPALIKNHKNEFIDIMAVVNNVTRDEYVESLTLLKLIADVLELVTDQSFASFFG